MKKRDKQVIEWMQEKREVLEHITDERDRLAYFQKTVLPELDALEAKEQRGWDENRADFDLDVLERGFESEYDVRAIPDVFVAGYELEDIIFSKDPADIHYLVTDRGLCYLLQQCTDRQKELLFYIDIHGCGGAEIAETEGVPTRNVTSVHARALDDIRTQLLPLILLKFKLERDPKWKSVARERFIHTIYEERFFCAAKGKEHLEYWEHPYFEGINFDLKPITEHFKSEPKRKKIQRRKRKTEVDENNS